MFGQKRNGGFETSASMTSASMEKWEPVLENLLSCLYGPLCLRLCLQPAMALLFLFRDGSTAAVASTGNRDDVIVSPRTDSQ
jgi:hypothetical protein